MDPQKLAKIARLAYVRSTDPKKRKPASASESLVGFDSEYDSRTGKLICFQLAGDKGSALFKPPLTVARLEEVAPKVSSGEKFALVAYVSLAELQFLDVLENGRAFFQGARGSLDVEFSDRVRVIDLARWFDGQSLAAAAVAFDLKKLEYRRDRISKSCMRDPKFRTYAIHDAELCFEIAGLLDAELREHDLSLLSCRTPAGAAASYWRMHFLGEKLAVPPRRVRWFSMRASWGGRAEAFARGRFEGVRELDLRSAYPRACIALGKFPRARDWEDWTLGREANAIGGFVHVEFEHPKTLAVPVLPAFVDGCLIYPRNGISFCTLEEWKLAQELGCKGTVLEGWTFRDGDASLSRCMADLLAQREKAKGARRVTLKLFANALTGKFIQSVRAFVLDDELALARRLELPLRDVVRLDECEKMDLGLSPKIQLGPCFLPEWYGLITGYVRAELGRMLQGSDPLYCATDAVWARNPSFEWANTEEKRRGSAYVARTRLGILWDGKTKPHVAFHSLANRTYATRALWLLAHGRAPKVRYRFRHSVKLREAARRGLTPGKWESKERLASFAWDSKRELLESWETLPWETPEDFLRARADLSSRSGRVRSG